MEGKAVHADALQTQASPASLVEDAHASRIRSPDLPPAFRVTLRRVTTLARLRPPQRCADHRLDSVLLSEKTAAFRSATCDARSCEPASPITDQLASPSRTTEAGCQRPARAARRNVGRQQRLSR